MTRFCGWQRKARHGHCVLWQHESHSLHDRQTQTRGDLRAPLTHLFRVAHHQPSARQCHWQEAVQLEGQAHMPSIERNTLGQVAALRFNCQASQKGVYRVKHQALLRLGGFSSALALHALPCCRIQEIGPLAAHHLVGYAPDA